MYLKKKSLLHIHLLNDKIIRREMCLPTDLKIKFLIPTLINLLAIRKGSLLSWGSIQENIYFRVTDHIFPRHYTLNWLKDEALLQPIAGHKHILVQNLKCRSLLHARTFCYRLQHKFFHFHSVPIFS